MTIKTMQLFYMHVFLKSSVFNILTNKFSFIFLFFFLCVEYMFAQYRKFVVRNCAKLTPGCAEHFAAKFMKCA